ncbi:14334_t:CDS:10 [Dentiscutata heterogama]|uniref:14334_t:CDS:1 n=1 Tax=Dentiscutata heterogama TaxID=1316150 RepID=A0ACA9JY01_9GLOM|nr:14334_t:CDS:10 [Dentiscutata heterogama]
MVAIHEILKKRILEAIRKADVQGGWKVVVVDEPARRIIESACKMYDILEEKVTLVEDLEKTRQSYPLEAVYIITPSQESVSKVIEDFTKQSTPLYTGAHVFLTSPPEHSVYQRLMSSMMPTNLLKAYKELFIEFHAREAQVYSFESPQSFFRLYSPVENKVNAVFDGELKKLAKQILSICVLLEENPLIRYQKGIDLDPDYSNKSLPFKLAQLVQAELDNYTRMKKQLAPGSMQQETQRKRSVLFIMDRTVDMYTPILHEFTYQAMANDLLPIENGQKYSYSYADETGAPANKETTLDETDSIWVSIRHKHMKDCIDQLMTDFNKFLVENEGFNDKDKAANLNDIKKMLATLPQFQTMKEKYAVHLNIAQESMSAFDKERLAEVATVEQNCATGLTSDSQHPKTLMEDMIPILDNPVISSSTKVRMLMLYIMYKRGISEEDRLKLLNHARISLPENESINNLEFFGEKLVKTKGGPGIMKKKKYRQPQGDDIHYEFSRYIPRLKNILESHINKTLDNAEYPYTKDPAGGPDGSKASSDLRSARPTWFLKGQEAKNPRIIVFIAGGVSYSELRTAYEITTKHRQDVIIGSTHIITPRKFVEDLSLLRKPPTRSYSPPKQRPLPTPPTTQNYNQYSKSPSSDYRQSHQSGYYPQGGPYPQPTHSQQGAYPEGNYQHGNYSYTQSNSGYQQQGYQTRPQYMNPKP